MNITNFLKEKKLIDENSSSFKIIKEDGEEFNLITIFEEFSNIQNDKYARLLAEFDNYKKRSNKEKEDIIIETKLNTMNSILDIDNDIDIALNTMNDEYKNSISIITSKIKNFLEKENIKEINLEYDENIHEVISVVPSDEFKIINTVSKGYKIGNKIIRYPKVILGKPNK